MAVGRALFCFCTVIFYYLDSRNLKKQDLNCRPTSRLTVEKKKVLHPTVGMTVENPQSLICTVAQNLGQQ